LQGRRNKKLFWLPAIAPLISVILSTLIVFLTKADKHGVKIVKHIKRGLNPSSIHQLQLSGPHVGEAAKVGLISAIIALTACPPFLFSIYCLL
jgi:low affinity sulfate transporter 2